MYRFTRLNDEIPHSFSKVEDDEGNGIIGVLRHRGLMRSAVIVCALVTVVNFAISVYSVQRSNVGPLATAPDSLAFLLGPPRQSRQEISRLRRPTQFIGLEKLNRSSTKHFINHPFLFAQIDREHKDDVLYNDDPRRVETLIGMTSANDRRVYVTQTISTVIQFRALDFGMELCEIRITLPTSESSSENEVSSILSPTPSLQLLRLNAPFAIDGYQLSYKTRPAVSHTVANIPTKSGFEWSYNFTCTTDEIITFELTCDPARRRQCGIDWWQSRANLNPAIFLVQYSTAQS